MFKKNKRKEKNLLVSVAHEGAGKRKIWQRPFLWAVVVFALSFLVYFQTVCPDVYLEDSGELIAAVGSWGVAHPPGYPLFVVVDGILSRLMPGNNFAFKVNVLSGLWGALSVALIFLILHLVARRFFESKREKGKENWVSLFLVPMVTSLTLAFSLTFWSQSIFAEVYTLNVLLSFLLILFLVRFEKTRQDKYIYWFFFISGLALTNHQMVFFLIPFFFLVFLMINMSLIKNWRLWLGCLFLFFLGFSVYLFIPFSATYLNPDMNWGTGDNLERFVNIITRAQYEDAGFNLWQRLHSHDNWAILHSFFLDIVDNFNYLGVGVAMIGMIFLWLKNKKFFYILGVIFVGNGLALVFLRNISATPIIEVVHRVYYLPVYAVVTILIGIFLFGLYYLFHKIKFQNKKIKRCFEIILVCLFALLPFSHWVSNIKMNDLSSFWLPSEWSQLAIKSMEPDSFIMLNNEQPAADSQVFMLMYQHAVNNLGEEVAFVDTAGIKGKFVHINIKSKIEAMELNEMEDKNYVEQTKDELELLFRDLLLVKEEENFEHYYGLQPIYDEEKNIYSVSNGYLYQYFQTKDEVRGEIEKIKKENKFLVDFEDYMYPALEYNMFYRDFVSEIFYNRAIYWAQLKDPDRADYYFRLGEYYDWMPGSVNFNLTREAINKYMGL